jgi:predicted solute-binding protein
MDTVGVVPYLNAVPLVADLPGDVRVVEAVPSELSVLLEAGRVDAALLPVAEAMRGVGEGFLGSYGIASEGAVESVLLFLPPGAAGGAPGTWPRRVVLDPASRTSVALFRVLCARAWEVEPPVEETAAAAGPEPGGDPGRMTLVIGDRAMQARREYAGAVVDLGEAWTGWTGLPFVYAAWTARRGLDAASRGRLARVLDEAADRGLRRREALAREHGPRRGTPPADAERYLARSIRYRIGPREREGLARFAAEVRAAGRVGRAASPR